MKIKEGKIYRTRDGRKVGPMKFGYSCGWPWILTCLTSSPKMSLVGVAERCAERFDRIASIIDRNLYHQHEKIEDAKSIAIAMREELRDGKSAAGLPIPPGQKELILLSIIKASGGNCDSSESQWNWINWFCNDETDRDGTDTFNRCNDKGWLHTTHDTSFDTSTTTLTKAGRAALATEDDHA